MRHDLNRLRVRYRHWLPGLFGARAMVLYPWVLFKYERNQVSDMTRRHELEHVYQVQRRGWWRFYLGYLWTWSRVGYKDHPDEIEARQAALEHPLTDEERRIF